MPMNSFDRAKALHFIKNANQIIFFVGVMIVATLAIGGAALNFLSGLGHRARVEGNRGTKEVEPIYRKNYHAKVKDTYVFTLSKTIISPKGIDGRGVNFGERMRKKGSGYVHQPSVNLIFVGPDNSAQSLFDKDSLITEIHLANSDKKKGYLLKSNIYEVAVKDTNKDGTLDYQDEKCLYLSSYNGLGLSLILDNIDSYEVLGDNTVLVLKRVKNQEDFYEYKVDSGKLTKLNTSIL